MEKIVSDEQVLIDYYDRIHGQWIYGLPVTKKVAEFLRNDNKKLQRNDNSYKYHIKRLETIFEKSINFNECLIEDKESNIEECLERLNKEQILEVLKEQKKVLIENSLDCLTACQREVVILAFYKNMTYTDISKMLGIKKQSVAERMKNAEKNIKNYIKSTQI